MLRVMKIFLHTVMRGLSENYYQNGQLGQKGTYKDGELNGLYKGYYENGKEADVSPLCYQNDKEVDISKCKSL